MGEVLGGLGVFGVVIAVGWVLGRTGAVPVGSDRVLTRIAFWAATPALLATTLGRADLGAVASGRTAAVVGKPSHGTGYGRDRTGGCNPSDDR